MKLIRKIDRFFNPKKYYDDRITKPINKLQRGDTIYALYIPIEMKNGFKKVTYNNFRKLMQHLFLYQGKIINMEKNYGNKARIEASSGHYPLDEKVFYIEDFKHCNKNYTTMETWGGMYFITTNKKEIVNVLDTYNMHVEVNYKSWKDKCKKDDYDIDLTSRYWFSFAPLAILAEDIKIYKKTMAKLKYKLKLL